MSKEYNSEKLSRRSIRVRGYDYSLPGYYFVTLVAKNRECIFGMVEGNQIRINEIGELVVICWLKISSHFDNTNLDEFVLMPNHLHGIVVIEEPHGRGEASHMIDLETKDQDFGDASPQHPIGTPPGSIGAIIQNFKSISTRKVNSLYFEPGNKIWQRNYYERIIRNDRELNTIRQYIRDNPLNWELDKENPTYM